MNDCFLHIESYAHGHLVEQVMALHGRGSSNPRRYRELLEGMSSAALCRAIEESDFPEFCGTNGAKTEEPLGCGANPLTDSASKGAEQIAVCMSQGSPSSPALQLSTPQLSNSQPAFK